MQKELCEKCKKNCADQQQQGCVYAESAAAGEGSSTAPIFAPLPTLSDENHHEDCNEN